MHYLFLESKNLRVYISPLAEAIIKAVFPLLSQMFIFDNFPRYSIASLYLRKIAIIKGLSPSSFLSSMISGKSSQNFCNISKFFSVIQKCNIVYPLPNNGTPLTDKCSIFDKSPLITAIFKSS